MCADGVSSARKAASSPVRRRIGGSDRAFADAMTDALGPEWNRNLDPQLRESAAHVNWARILFPFWFRRRGVQRLRNIQYVDDGRKRHRLDVYRSAETREDAPVLLQI